MQKPLKHTHINGSIQERKKYLFSKYYNLTINIMFVD